jgi:MarR family transcriptional regulator for hemolysin
MDPARDDDPLTRRLVFLGKQLRETFEAMLAERGSTLPTWAVLRYVARHDDLSQAQLAARIGIEGPTLTRHLDRLCAEGLVMRHRDEHDRRILRVSLTPAGEALFEELRGDAEDLEKRLTAGLTRAQRTALDGAIRSITDAMEDAHALV